MILKNIHIENFKSIESLDLNFESTTGLCEINGPVGSGKTSIGEAILYVLYGNVQGKNLSDLVKWNQPYMRVYAELEVKSHIITIDRVYNKKSKLEVKVDGSPLYAASQKELQESLEEYYDVSKMAMDTLCIINFNNFKTLTSMGAANTRAFLNSVFRMSTLSDYSSAAKEEMKTIDTNLRDLQKKNAALEERVRIYSSKHKAATNEYTVEDLQLAESLLQKNCDRLKTINKESNTEVGKLNKQAQEISVEIGEIVAKGKDLNKKIEFIKKGVCPTCGAPISDEHLHEYEAEKADLASQYNKKKEEHTNLVNKTSIIKKEYDKLILEVNKTANAYTEQITKMRQAITDRDFNQEGLDEAKRELDKLSKSIDVKEKESRDWSELARIIDYEIRQKVTAALIPSLNKAILGYCSELGCQYTVEFDDSFECIVKLAANDTEIPVSSLSTGQTKMINLIVILGVLKVLLGSMNFNIQFLDELLSNMDYELREKMCILLKRECPEGKTVFVISHAELPSSVIEKCISLNLHNGTTVLE